MKYSATFLLTAAMLFAAAAQAGTITFCGREWATADCAARDDASVTNLYTVSSDGLSGTITGVFGGANTDSAIATPLTLHVGDSVSYDYYVTNEQRDRIGDGLSNWVNDSWAGFIENTDPWTNWTVTAAHKLWSDRVVKWTADGSDVGVIPATGLHFDWLFTSATEYSVAVVDIASGSLLATWNGVIADGKDISSIQAFRMGIWDSEQDATIANFVVVPEPATLALLGLGALSLVRRKR
ncbi:MAG TPA: PEP-CTERM sorting domain-containing protein [Anaerohalosphaeraceae bacterium]|jgi:hypothetical protein|nr:PEP-CTERM sorting domain-containing protein [Anaerohalosphaeraceae bacterium]HRT50919.1 PEP-CTERM sorting domain-containing protein [Anaerohalosphaeraceae bacterium]HRT86620.1 PEP-CTERM sorting domain-containing protein [Anaerohalosphaeraceae bacterium]